MPKHGFKSITVNEEAYDEWQAFFEKNRKSYRRQGLTTFSGFVVAIMNGFIDSPFKD